MLDLQSCWTCRACWLHSSGIAPHWAPYLNILISIRAGISRWTRCAQGTTTSWVAPWSTVDIHGAITRRTSHARRTRGASRLIAQWKCTHLTRKNCRWAANKEDIPSVHSMHGIYGSIKLKLIRCMCTYQQYSSGACSLRRKGVSNSDSMRGVLYIIIIISYKCCSFLSLPLWRCP